MQLLIVNPNSTADMTDRIGEEARLHLRPGITLTTVTNVSGPPSIQGEDDGRAAHSGTLSILAQSKYDVAIIGCFDDTALADAPQDKDRTTIGLGHAALSRAYTSGSKFAVLTTSALSVPVLEGNIRSYGMERLCVLVRASDIDVLDFETQRDIASQRLIEAGKNLKTDHPEIETIVLGCAGMGGLATQIEDATGLRVIDPITAAVEQAISIFGPKRVAGSQELL